MERQSHNHSASQSDLHSFQDLSSICESSYFLSAPMQTVEQIEKMKILKAKFPEARQSYQVKHFIFVEVILTFLKHRIQPTKKSKGSKLTNLSSSSSQELLPFISQPGSQPNMNSTPLISGLMNQPFKGQQIRSIKKLGLDLSKRGSESSIIHYPRDSYRSTSLNFKAIVPIEKNRLLPEISEAKQITLPKYSNDEQHGYFKMNIEDSVQEGSMFLHKHQSLPNIANTTVIGNFPKNLTSTIRLDRLLESCEKLEGESTFVRQNYLNSSKFLRKTSILQPMQKKLGQQLSKQSVIDINDHNLLNRLDYFSEENMIHISIPNISNFQVEPIQKYDEEQLYDEDFKAKFKTADLLRGFSKWSDVNGATNWKECVIESYNEEKKTFIIRWIANGKRKEVTRINLLFENESQEKGDQRYARAKERREMMLFFLSMKNTIINKEMQEQVSHKSNLINEKANLNVIQYPVHRLQRILEKSVKYQSFSEETDLKQSTEQIIQGVLQFYTYNVIKFNYQFHTVFSMTEFYKKYLEDYDLTKKGRKLIIESKKRWIISEFFCLQETPVLKNENGLQKKKVIARFKQLRKINIKNPIPVARIIPLLQQVQMNDQELRRISELEDSPRLILSQLAGMKRKSKLGPLLLRPSASVVLTEEEEHLISSATNQQRKIEEISMKIELSETHITDLSYVNTICTKMSLNSLIFSRDKKFDLFHLVLPMLASFVTCFKEINIFKGFKKMQIFNSEDAIALIKSFSKDISRQLFKIERIVDKIDTALDELNKGFTNHLNNNNIPISPNPWKDRVYIQIAKMTNSLIQSHLILTINESISDAIKSILKYYAILPIQYFDGHDIQNLTLELQKRRKAARRNIMLDSNLLTDIGEVKQTIDDLDVKSPPRRDSINLNKRTSLPDWQCFRDAEVIYSLQKQICQILLKENIGFSYHQLKFLDAIKLPVKPIFLVKMTVLNEKTEEGKKSIQNVLKSIGTSSSKKKGEEITDGFILALKSREKFYNYEEISISQMFKDIARRNINEFEIPKTHSELENMKENIVEHRLGWFNLNSFFIKVEPSLDSIEKQLKSAFLFPLKQIENQQKLSFGYQTDASTQAGSQKDGANKFLYSQEYTQSAISNLKSCLQDFLQDSFFSVYALLNTLMNFEFYLLYSKQYDKYLSSLMSTKDIQKFELVFEEMALLQRDLKTIKCILPDQFILGIFIVDIRDFKAALTNEINLKQFLIKKQLQLICVETLKQNEDLEMDISKSLDVKPQTIEQFIKINSYLEGEEITKQIETILKFINISTRLFEQLELYLVKLDQQNYTDMLQQNSMLRGILEMKAQKQRKQEENKPRFRKMHMEKKSKLLDDINEVKNEIETFIASKNLDEAYNNHTTAEQLKSKLNQLEEKVKEIRYEEIHLNTGYDSKLDLEQSLLQFNYYAHFWRFASEWKYKKEQWLGKQVVDNAMGASYLKDIETTLENGNAMVRQVETYFQENDTGFSQLVTLISNSITKYEEIFDFLVLVSHESFKQEHWNLVLEALYTDDPLRKKEIINTPAFSTLTLQEVLKDNILSIIDYIKSIAGQAENEFKVHESIKILENELKKIGFSAINYFGLFMLQNTSEISSYMKLQIQIIGNMIKNKVYSRNDFAHKLAELEQQVLFSRKVIKNIGLLQNKFIKIIPIINFAKNLSYLKDGIKDFNKCKDSFEVLIKELRVRGLPYLLEMFTKKDVEDSEKSQNQTSSQISHLSQHAKIMVDTLINNNSSLANLENSLTIIIKHIRSQNSRFTFFSDYQILNLCESVYNTKEFSDTIRQAFGGIQSFHIASVSQAKQEQNDGKNNASDSPNNIDEDDLDNNNEEQFSPNKDPKKQKPEKITGVLYGTQRFFQIHSVKNWYNEVIQFNEPIQYSLQQYDDPPTFTMVKDIEMNTKQFIRQAIIMSINTLTIHSYKYTVLWSLLTSRQVIFQVLYLLNDLIFYHDLTIILATRHINYKQKLLHLKEYINSQLFEFIKILTKAGKISTIPKITLIQHNQLVLQILHHLEILDEFCDLKDDLVEGLGSYEYLVLPKFTLQMSSKLLDNISDIQMKSKEYGTAVLVEGITNMNKQQDAQKGGASLDSLNDLDDDDSDDDNNFPNLSHNSPLFAAFKNKEFDICLLSMSYKKSYSFEVTPQLRGFVTTPGCRRIFHQLIQALSTNSGALLHGPQASGKTACFENLCILLAKPYFIWKFEADQSYNTIHSILTGVAAGGFWLQIKSIESCDLGVLSALAQFNGKSYQVESSYGIVCSFTNRLSANDHHFESLPKSLLENFRVISIVEPEISEIVNKYFVLLGHIDNATELTNKWMNFIRFISSGYFRHDGFSAPSQINQPQKDGKNLFSQEFSPGNLISTRTILKIIRLTMQFQQEKSTDISESIAILQANVYSYFSSLLREDQCDFVMKSFCSFFGQHDQQFNYCEMFEKDYAVIQENARQFLSANHLVITPHVQKIINNIYPLVTKKTTIIFAGRSGKNKSFFIRMLGYLFSKSKKKEFLLNWFKIDSISPERLLGYFNSKGEWEEGVIPQLISSMGRNNEQKKVLNKMKYYGNKNFSSCPASQLTRQSLAEKQKQNNSSQAVQQFLSSKSNDNITEDDWIVIDASSQVNNLPHSRSLDRLLSGFYNRSFNLSNQDILKVPQGAFCLFEMESLRNLSPNNLANNTLVYLSEDAFSLKEEFSAWLLKMATYNDFFRQFDFAAKLCFTIFFQGLIEEFEKMPPTAFRYIVSKKAHLNNFLNYFEIFLNEVRKLEIASGEWEDPNNKGPNIPRLNLRKIKNQQQSIIKGEDNLISDFMSSPMKVKKGQQDKFRFSDSLVDELQSENSIDKTESMQFESIASSQKDVKSMLRTEYDVRLVSYLESIFIFSLTWSVANILKSEQRNTFNAFLKQKKEVYINYRMQQTRVRFTKENYPFALNLEQAQAETSPIKEDPNGGSIFDLCLDLVRSEWIPWSSLSLEEFGVISGGLVSNSIDNKEIIRLNPYAIDIVENKISKEGQNIALPDKALFVETKSTKITKHFLQYFVAYQKPLFLISMSQNGMTTLVNQRTQVLIEQFNYSPLFVSCTQNMTVKQFQKKIESNLIASQPYTLTPPNRTNGIVIVDDLNLAMAGISPIGAIRSFLEGSEWYSNCKNRFVEFQNLELLCLYSHNGQQSTNMFDQRYCNIPLSVIEKSMIFKMPNQNTQDLISIFTEYNSNASSGLLALQSKHSENITYNLIYQLFQSTSTLALIIIKHRFKFAEIQSRFNVNLSIKKAIEIVRNLNYFDFFDNRNNISINSYFKSLIFLLNQYYAQEFMHNSCEQDDQKQQIRNTTTEVSYAPSITRAFSNSNDSDENQKEEIFTAIGGNNSDGYVIEYPKTSIIENLHEIDFLRENEVSMSCYEKILLFTNILDNDNKDKRKDRQELNTDQKKVGKVLSKQDQESQAQKLQRDQSVDLMKTKIEEDIEDDIISEKAEELFQKRVIQVWHTPSRHVQLAFKSTFMQKSSKFKILEKQHQETAYNSFLQKLMVKVEGISFNTKQVEDLPLQLVQSLVQLIIGEELKKVNIEKAKNAIKMRNEVLFFNEELFDFVKVVKPQEDQQEISQQNAGEFDVIEEKDEDSQNSDDEKQSIELHYEIKEKPVQKSQLQDDHPEKDRSSAGQRNVFKDDDQKAQFTMITKKNQKNVVEFLAGKIQSFPHRAQLIELFCTRENSIYTLYYHCIKLMHLIQISSQSIILQSIITIEATIELVRFTAFALKFQFTIFDPASRSWESKSEFKSAFLNQLETAISGIFHTEQMSILFINMSDFSTKTKLNETWILEILNSLLKGSEILTLFSKKKWEKLINQWKMHKKFIGLSNFILYYLIASRLQKKLKILLYYEPKPTKYDQSMDLISSYPKLMEYFTRYTLITPVDPLLRLSRKGKSKNSEIISVTEQFKEFTVDILNRFYEDTVKRLYHLDFEVQGIYSQNMSCFMYKTYEQTKHRFYYTYQMVKLLLEEKIFVAEKESILFELTQVCEKKQEKYEIEILTTQQKLEHTISTLHNCKQQHAAAEQTIEKQEDLIQKYQEEEKSLSELLSKAIYNENAWKSAEKDFFEPLNKIIKMDPNPFNEDIQVKKMTAVKQMNQYIMMFFILFSSVIDHPQFTEEKLFSDISESVKRQANYNPIHDTINMDMYRDIFESIISSHQIFKKVLTEIKQSSFTKQQNDMMFNVSKSDGKQENNSYLFSLSNNFNLAQREVINIIELALKFMKVTIEKKKIPLSSFDLENKIREIKFNISDIILALKEPKRVFNELPPKIAILHSEQSSLEAKLVLKAKGKASFIVSKQQIDEYYKENFKKESFGLSLGKKLDEIVCNLTVMIMFIMGYPNYVRDSVSGSYSQVNGININFIEPKLPILLLGETNYYSMIKLRFPQNSQIIEKLCIIDFLQAKDIYYPPLIIDQVGIFEMYMREKSKKENQTIIFENWAVGKESKSNILNAIKYGHTLVLSNFNDELLQLVEPIVQWKANIVEQILQVLLFSKHPSKQQNQNPQSSSQKVQNQPSSSSASKTSKSSINNNQQSTQNMEIPSEKQKFQIFTKHRGSLDFHEHKTLKVHQNFRIYFLFEKTSFSFPANLLKKVHLINLDIEDELSWKLTMNDLLIQQMHFEKKEEVMNNKISKITTKQSNLNELLNSVLDRLNNNVNCEDLICFEAIEEDLKKASVFIQNQNEREIQDSHETKSVGATSINISVLSKQDSKHKMVIPEADIGEEESPLPQIVRNSIFSRLADPQIQERHAFSSSLIEIEDHQSKRNSAIVSSSLLISSQKKIRDRSDSQGSEQSINSIASIVIKRRQLVLPRFTKKQSIRVNLADDQESELDEIAILGFKELDLELSQFGNLYVSILDFIYGVKMNWINLGKTLGSIYSFSEIYMIMLVKQTCDRCLKERNTLNLESDSNQILNFSNRFCENVITILSGIFRSDHLILFNFELAMMYQRGLESTDPESFNESEWKFLLGHRIDNINIPEIQTSEFEKSWAPIFEQFINQYNLSDLILAPLLNKHEVDHQIFIQEQKAQNQISADSQYDGNEQKPVVSTKKALSKFKNLIGKEQKESPVKGNLINIIPASSNRESPVQEQKSSSINSNFKLQISPSFVTGKQVASPENQTPLASSHKESDTLPKIPSSQLNVLPDQLGNQMQSGHRTSVHRKSINFGSSFGDQLTNLNPSEGSGSGFQLILRELTSVRQIQIGISPYKQFYSLMPLIQENSKLKVVVNSISDHFKEWMNYLASSVKIANRNEEKIILFKEYPNNIQSKITSQQSLLVAKYFRPDCLLRYSQLYIRKCFKYVMKITHKTSMEGHVNSNWYKRPTMVFFNGMDKSIAESLELKAAKNHIESFLVRLNCGFIPIEHQCIELENAAGAGAWVIIENMENLKERDMGHLIRKINQELENPSTTSTFKIWISIALNSSSTSSDESDFKTLDFKCQTQECSNMMKGLAMGSWKIFLNDSTNISQSVERLFNIEAQEYKAYRDQKQTQYKMTNIKSGAGISNISSSNSGSMMNMGLGLVGGKRHANTEKILVHKSLINCYVHKNLRMRLSQLNRATVFNFASILNTEHLATQFPEWMDLISRNTQKYRFGLAFILVLAKMKQKLSKGKNQQRTFYASDFDIYFILEDIMNFLESYPINPQRFIEKYIDFIFPFENHFMLNLVKRYVTVSMDTLITIKMKEDAFQYVLYNFQGSFNNAEEAIIKTLKQYPQEDPILFFDLSQSLEFQQEFKKSKRFLDRLLVIDKRWETSKISTILKDIQKLMSFEKDKAREFSTPALAQKSYLRLDSSEESYSVQSPLPNISFGQESPHKSNKQKKQSFASISYVEERISLQQKNFPLKYLQNLRIQENQTKSIVNLIDLILSIVVFDTNLSEFDKESSQIPKQYYSEENLATSILELQNIQAPNDNDIIRFKRRETAFHSNLNNEQVIFPSRANVTAQKRSSKLGLSQIALNVGKGNNSELQTEQSREVLYTQVEDSPSNTIGIFKTGSKNANKVPPITRMDSKKNTDASGNSPTPTSPLRSPNLISKLRLDDLGNSKEQSRPHLLNLQIPNSNNQQLKQYPSSSFEREGNSPTENKNPEELKMIQEYQIQFENKPQYKQKDIKQLQKTAVSQKLLFLNEYFLASRLVNIIRQDLLRIRDQLRLKDGINMTEELKQVVTSLKENEVPLAWWKNGFFNEESETIPLVNFIKLLTAKLEYITLLFNDDTHNLTRMINLSLLFDPLAFIQSSILAYAVKNQQNLLGVKVVLQRSSSPKEVIFSNDEVVSFTGLIVRFGKINKDTLFLEEDSAREFESPLNEMRMIITSKPKKAMQYLFEKIHANLIPIEIYDTKANTPYHQHDMESEHYNQILFPPQLYDYRDSLPTNIVQKETQNEHFRLSLISKNTQLLSQTNQNRQTIIPSMGINNMPQNRNINLIPKNLPKKPLEISLDEQPSTQINYSVRIPVQNPLTDSLYSQFPCQFYLYIYSKKPQDYWDRRGTLIVLNSSL